MERLLVVGAGGHARAVLDVVLAARQYEAIGFVDSRQTVGTERMGLAILGGEAQVPDLWREHRIDRAIVAIGDNFQRMAMIARLRERLPALRLARCIHPDAVLGRGVEVGDGAVIMPGVVVVGGSSVGEGCVLNTASSLDHDGTMEAGSSLAPGVVTGGAVRVGRRSFVGLGARIVHGVRIGEDAVIGAGSLVLGDVPDRVVAHGSPCRVVRSRAADAPYL